MKRDIIFWLVLGMFCLAVQGGLLAADLNLSTSSSKTEWPAIAVNSAGQIMVVWTEWEGQGNLYYRTYQNGQWSEKRNAGIVYQWAWSNQLDVDSKGVFHLSMADGYGSTTRDIYYSSYTGSSWRQLEMLYDSPHNSAWNKMSVDTNDEINVIWYHKYFDPPGISDVVAMRKAKGGSWPANYTNLSRRSSLESINPAIRVKNREAHAVWMEGESGGWALRYAHAKNWEWSTPVSIVGLGYYPAMAMDDLGGVHVAYSNRSGNYSVISRAGGSWGSSRSVSGGTAPLQFGDIRHRSGYIVAAWVEDHGGTYYVYYANKRVGGAWSQPIRVSSGDSLGDGNKHVQVAVDSQGFAHIVWEGRGSGGREDVFYSKVMLIEPDSPFIEIDKLYMDFKTDQFLTPSPQSFNIRNAGKDTLNYSISTNRTWLVASPPSGNSSGENDIISVEVNPGGKSVGTYDGAITIKAPEAVNSPLILNVSLTIEANTKPHISLSTSSLFFTAQAHGGNPEPQSFQIRNTGAATLTYQVESTQDWLKVTPQSGASTSEWDAVSVSIKANTFAVGTYNGFIRVKAAEADNTPQLIPVTLRIDLPPYPYPPVNVSVAQLAHEGLMIKIYKNTVTWGANKKNNGLFNINKYVVWRRLKAGGAYQLLAEVNSDVFSLTDDDFSSLADRDRWAYAVSCLDITGWQSPKKEPSTAAKLPAKTTSQREKKEIKK